MDYILDRLEECSTIIALIIIAITLLSGVSAESAAGWIAVFAQLMGALAIASMPDGKTVGTRAAGRRPPPH